MDRPQLPPSDPYAPTSLPSTGARALAFAAIVVAGICGGLIGYAVTDLQGGSAALAGAIGVIGALGAAVGVGVVAVLALRAMGEWKMVQQRDRSRPA